jgi:hypothetical protein
MKSPELTTLRQDILLELRTSVRRRKSPWRTPVISTVDQSGRAKSRLAVLRKATNQNLELHTDVRSDKWRELAQDPRITWTFWDRGRQIQLRVEGIATLHTQDSRALDTWQALSNGARRTYCVAPAPGTPVSAPNQYSYDAAGVDVFGVISSTIDRMDWLHLGREGHRRAVFIRDAEEWLDSFVVP